MFLDIFEFLHFGLFFPFFQKIGFCDILGRPSYGIGATIRIGQEMLCLPYAGFFLSLFFIQIEYLTFQEGQKSLFKWGKKSFFSLFFT